MNRSAAHAAALALLALTAAAAGAHSSIKRTAPASGSVLQASPAEIVIEFNEPARMTSLLVVAADQSERKLEFEPPSSTTSFVSKEPRLGAGRNEVRWRALSKDGHPISGTIIVVIKPGAKPPDPAGPPDPAR